MKFLAAIFVGLGLVIAILPQFTNCEYGKTTATSTSSAAMANASMQSTASTSASVACTTKCFWTARAELAVGIPLIVIGAFLFFARRKESRRALSALAVIEGLFVILLPAALIGLCSSDTMRCRTTMEPILYISGALVILAGLSVFAWNEMRRESQVR